jgi:hypothetical protein
MKIVRESMKVIREREILDALEGKGRTQEGGKS